MDKSSHVVCLGSDPALLQTRQAVLAMYFQVTPISNVAALMKLSFGCPYELFVLCHTLSQADFSQAVALIHTCCPSAGIVALTTNDSSRNVNGADHWLSGLDGPAALLDAVRLTLHERHPTLQSMPAIA